MLRDPHLIFRRKPADPGRLRTESTIDGEERQLELEMRLNKQAAQLFATGGGKEFLDYLKLITQSRVCPPASDAGVLYFYEGARWLVATIQARVHAGQKQGEIGYAPPDLPPVA